jgi:hypothetical protein
MASYRCTIGITPEQEGSSCREGGKFCRAHEGSVAVTKLYVALGVWNLGVCSSLDDNWNEETVCTLSKSETMRSTWI